jgi:pantoate kinase
MRFASCFVPAHISGFFEPCPSHNPYKAGSRNCGPCLELGVRTEVKLNPSLPKPLVKVNGKPLRAPTTLQVLRELELLGAGVEIHHVCGIPIGSGFGASGAGALGAALALAELLSLPYPREQLVRAAHRAEVACGTGLGDVLPQSLGGLVFSLEPGAPPHGRWIRLRSPAGLRVICCSLGALRTKKLLGDQEFIRRCKLLGRRAVKRLRATPNIKTFLQVSREFAEGLGLFDQELRGLAEAAERAGALGASQALLGRSVFAFASEKMASSVFKVLADVAGAKRVFATKISATGPRRPD